MVGEAILVGGTQGLKYILNLCESAYKFNHFKSIQWSENYTDRDGATLVKRHFNCVRCLENSSYKVRVGIMNI